MKHRVLSVFLALMVVLFSVRVSDVDADEVAVASTSTFTVEDVNALGFFGDFTDTDLQNIYNLSINPTLNFDNVLIMRTEDSFYFQQYNSSSSVWGYNVTSTSFIVCTYYLKSYDDNYFYYSTYDFSSNHYYNLKSFGYSSIISPSLNFNTLPYENFCLFIRQSKSSNDVEFFYCSKDTIDALGVSDIQGVFAHERFLMNKNGTASRDYPYIPRFCNLGEKKSTSLEFYIAPDLSDDMDMNNLNTNFTIDVENETDNAYNYCIYISSQPASVGIVNSLQIANYFLSSTQWCYVFQQDYQLDADLIDQIKNNVSDNYTTTDILDYMLKGAPITNLTNVWGGVYNGAKEYIALKNNSMSFYSLVQTNCPVYAIGSNAIKTHVVDYACLNVNLDTQYYLNIIYYHPDMNIVAGIGSSTAALVDAAYGESRLYPIYNVDFFRDYTVYDSIPFSFVNGTFSISEDDVTKYNDVVQNSNPANAAANISSDDDNVNINNSNSYDSSVKTNYYNYGTIYHNCTWGSSGAGGSGSSIVAPKVPEFDFDQLTAGCGNFLKFVKHVFFECLPEIFTTMLLAAFAVVIYCRVWGR